MVTIQKYKVRLAKDGVLRVAERVATDYEHAKAIFFGLLANLPHEEIQMICLNGQSEVLGTVRIAMGGLHGCALTGKDVFRPAVAMGASAIILGHNHPSGDPTPSADDENMTKHLMKVGDLIGVRLLDHIVVCPERGTARSVLP